MSFLRHIKRIKRLDQLIRMRMTGNPGQLAVQLNISRRHLYGYLCQLKEMGAEIGYCRRRKTFYYKNNLIFICGYIDKSNAIHREGTKILDRDLRNFLSVQK